MSRLRRTLIEEVFYPPHDPRTASAVYRKTHERLVVELDEPCWICGIRHSDVLKLTADERARWQIETHHAELEWAAAGAFLDDGEMLARLTADHAAILDDPKRLREWLDSEGNMLILCATHHRGPRTGIHSITYPAWKLQRYQYPAGFQFIQQPSK